MIDTNEPDRVLQSIEPPNLTRIVNRKNGKPLLLWYELLAQFPGILANRWRVRPPINIRLLSNLVDL